MSQRIDQEVAEAILRGTPQARVDQEVAETITRGKPLARVN